MKIFLLLVALLPSLAFSASFVDTKAAEFELNQASQNAMAKHRLGTKLLMQAERSLKCQYSFAVQGGAVGTVSLLDEQGKACKLPKNAIVLQAMIDVLTDPTSGGAATIALGTGASTTDLKAATAIASYTGLVAGVPVDTAATAIKLSADQTPSATIATAALTAGKINVHIRFKMSE